jgi:L-amino acid N-acyltransferase YncA
VPSPGDLAIQLASPDDAKSICVIYNEAISERNSTFETVLRTPDDFQERISDTQFPLLVAKLSDGVLGWAGLAPYSARPCYSGIAECSV